MRRRKYLRQVRRFIESLEDRLLLAAAPLATADHYFIQQDETLSAVSSDLQPEFHYNFNSDEIPSGLKGDQFVVENGVIHRDISESDFDNEFLRTEVNNFRDRDFVFELTFTTKFPANAQSSEYNNNIYIGIGHGNYLPDLIHQELAASLFLQVSSPGSSEGVVQIVSTSSEQPETIGNISTAGEHRARITKIGSQIDFAVDAHFNGRFEADLSHTISDIDAAAPYLAREKSHLFFGSARTRDYFDDFTLIPLPARSVLANDISQVESLLSATLVNGPVHGQIQFHPDGTFVYDPEAGFHGVDQFQYQADDGELLSEIATVTIEVANLPDPTTVRNDVYELNEGSVLEVDPIWHSIQTVPLTEFFKGIDYDPIGQKYYLAYSNPNIPSRGYVVPLDPFTGTTDREIVVGSDPAQLAVSDDDGKYLYVGLNGDKAIARVNLATQRVDGSISLGDLVASDIETIPGSRSSIAVALYDPRTSSGVRGAAIFDNLVRRPGNNGNLQNHFDFNDDGTLAVGILTEISSRDVAIEQTTDEGFRGILVRKFFIPGNPSGEIEWVGERIFFGESPQVFSPDGLEFMGVFPYSTTTADEGSELFYSLSDTEIAIGSLNTLLPDFAVPLPDEFQGINNRGITRFGDDGVGFFAKDQLVLAQSDLISGVTRPRGVLSNDLNTDGVPLNARLVRSVTHGNLDFNTDGSFRYVPTSNFSGTDQFSYVVEDGDSVSEVATVTLNVLVESDSPVAIDDAYEVAAGTSLTINAPGILQNDTLVGENINVSLLEPTKNGSISLHPDGSFDYVPLPGFTGVDQFTYQVRNQANESSDAEVTILVGDDPNIPPPDVTQGLIHHWTFDEVAGNIANDSVGRNDGTLNNWDSQESKWIEGAIGGAIEFNGTDNYIITDSPISQDHYTITFWLNWSSRDGINARIFVPLDGHDMGDWGILISDEFSRGVGFTYNHGKIFAQDPNLPSLGVWEHYAIAIDRVDSSAIIYRDGTQVASSNIPAADPMEPWVIGHGVTLTNHIDTLDGKLDDLRVYDRLLQSDEVATLAGRKEEPSDSLSITTDTSWRAIGPVGNQVGQSFDTAGAGWENANVGWNTSLTYDDSAENGWNNAIKIATNPDPTVIWSDGDGNSGSTPSYFRREFVIDGQPTSGLLDMKVDDDVEIYINGTLIFSDTDELATEFTGLDITPFLLPGSNLFTAKAHDAQGAEGFGAVLTVTYDDSSILTIEGISKNEGTDGRTDFDFDVTLSNTVLGGFDISFAVHDRTATDADDFDVITTSPLSFAGIAGETQTITVRVDADSKVEENELFTVVLGNLTNLAPGIDPEDIRIVGRRVFGEILNDDIINEIRPTVDTTEDLVDGNVTSSSALLTTKVLMDKSLCAKLSLPLMQQSE